MEVKGKLSAQVARWDRKAQIHRGKAPLERRIDRECGDDLVAAGDWVSFGWTLERAGYKLEWRPRGMLFTDGEKHVSASRVSPELSRPALEMRYKETPRLPQPGTLCERHLLPSRRPRSLPRWPTRMTSRPPEMGKNQSLNIKNWFAENLLGPSIKICGDLTWRAAEPPA